MSEIAIKVENLSKIYKLYDKPMDRLKESLSISKKKYGREHYALKDISFEIKRGETVGILGTNGSGKSTLLKIITGVLTPSSGNIEVNGKISALLELGAGFNPEYTGIENIYLNGTMMGYTREEMQQRVQPIMDFADIGEFINQPVKTYSSGMFARLAFAVAINVEPEILIVDEALSVGDTRFQTKCIDKMKQLKDNGTTILFVSHATEQVKRFCTKGIWINKGEVVEIGGSSEIVDKYEAYMLLGEKLNTGISMQSEEETKKEELSQVEEDKITDIPGNGILARITSVTCNSSKFKTFDNLEVIIEYEIYDDRIPGFLIGVALYTPNRDYIFGPNTYLDKIVVPNKYGRHKVKYIVPSIPVLGGSYSIDVGIFNNEGIVCIDYKTEAQRILVTNEYFSEGRLFIEHKWEVVK
ncbi:teichoic acid transport system ATP-binding protein [Clostridium saccharoperbutylacetonicum]|uniref:ABC-type polysaccharide/polyol phosphate transport system, ATPase component n=1 Tax=Clostridium saccharoperbutylacetonicum N1-4(HMT) TaxID=931276 RepID=M1M0S3_9CLOT|nr:ABC transporter ATP-binding protein [Clostridium saccharoperbutylacetonicum]AGF59170.1 ABC-type polysaccharide/polyol phosphate transport system, ATPase component [Clostridium saccharoperbutylacetonicum N1-4(HMT)]NRT60043.1 teichoic acid transport system ATP-binding protein [Clostridium saccharoperbutylacetonicum]NSB23355.1 teichoic acid transport system ATP-binding protein [Clostridium saccharoperbutylacetonicum]NSB42725.1 teichoic acid transport system ATP-binding protein [Clostridium sacc